MKATRQIKRIANIVFAAGVMVLWLGTLSAVVASGNPDTLEMTVSVDQTSVEYAVSIASPEAAGYDFGQVSISGTTISTKAIAVTNAGNISEFFSVGVVDVTNTYAWTNNGASLTPATTSYVMQAQFVATGAGQPQDASFAVAANNAPSASPNTAESKFNQGAGQAGKTKPGDSKDLWLQLKMPTGVEETGTHTLVLSVNGQSN